MNGTASFGKGAASRIGDDAEMPEQLGSRRHSSSSRLGHERMAPSGNDAGALVPASPELLQFYRERVQTFADEREAMVQRVAALEVDHETAHRIRWELRVREEEVAELQKALADASVYLYDERDRALRLAAENEQLKAQETEDRRRIAHLLALTRPVGEEVTFFRDCRPESLQSFPPQRQAGIRHGAPGKAPTVPRGPRLGPQHRRRDTRGNRHQNPTAAGTGAVGSMEDQDLTGNTERGMDGTEGGSSRVLRTVFLPSERQDALMMRVAALQQQLRRQQELADERAAAWRADREAREASYRRRAEADAAAIRASESEASEARARLRAVTRDLLQQRLRAEEEAAGLREHAAATEAVAEQTAGDAAEIQEAAQRQAEALRGAAKEESRSLREAVTAGEERRQDEVKLLQRQFQRVKGQHEEQAAVLEQQLGAARRRASKAERRRALEVQGFARDVAALRRQLRQLETQWALVGEAQAKAGAGYGARAGTGAGGRAFEAWGDLAGARDGDGAGGGDGSLSGASPYASVPWKGGHRSRGRTSAGVGRRQVRAYQPSVSAGAGTGGGVGVRGIVPSGTTAWRARRRAGAGAWGSEGKEGGVGPEPDAGGLEFDEVINEEDEDQIEDEIRGGGTPEGGPFVGVTANEDDLRFGEAGGQAVAGWSASRLQDELRRLRERGQALAAGARQTEAEAGRAIDRLQSKDRSRGTARR